MPAVSITIDQRPVLEAAELLGIRIPALCHVKGLEPSSSLCAQACPDCTRCDMCFQACKDSAIEVI